MAKFKVGDRAKIMYHGDAFGKHCTIVDGPRSEFYLGKLVTAYFVSVDGRGAFASDGMPMGYEPHELEPLTPPHQEQWEAFKTLYLKPQTHLVQAAENSEFIVY